MELLNGYQLLVQRIS